MWEATRALIRLRNQAPPLQPAAQNRPLPLSLSQERLWFLHRSNPGATAYNVNFAFSIAGALHIAALEQSFRNILQRHGALRTTFEIIDGRPVQSLGPLHHWHLPLIDLRAWSEAEQQTRLQTLAAEEATTPFNLGQGPLLRACLVQLSEEAYIVYLTFHHIVYDVWSHDLLFRELAATYQAFSTGQASPLPELALQYPDFAIWQRQWLLQDGVLESLLSYWVPQLANLSELRLPTDHPRTATQTQQSKQQTVRFSKALTENLKALTREERSTLFTTLLAAFKILLHRYTACDDLFVCTPIANRIQSELSRLMGYFVNLLVLRSDLSGDPTFRELLGQVRQVVSGAIAHQDLLVQLLETQVTLSRVMFAFVDNPWRHLALPDLVVKPLEDANTGTSGFDLFLELTEEAGTLIGVLRCNGAKTTLLA
jgi:hypothetical protein